MCHRSLQLIRLFSQQAQRGSSTELRFHQPRQNGCQSLIKEREPESQSQRRQRTLIVRAACRPGDCDLWSALALVWDVRQHLPQHRAREIGGRKAPFAFPDPGTRQAFSAVALQRLNIGVQVNVRERDKKSETVILGANGLRKEGAYWAAMISFLFLAQSRRTMRSFIHRLSGREPAANPLLCVML